MTKGSITLAILSVAQFSLLLLIYFKSGLVDQDLRAGRSVIPADPVRRLHANSVGVAEASMDPVVMTESQLRRIIREEFRSQIERTVPNVPQQEKQLTAMQEVDDAVMTSRRDFVSGQLDYYSSVGSISSVEMAQLQMNIAGLDERARKEMMYRLNRALNTGVLSADF